MHELTKKFKENIKLYRISLGLTQQQLVDNFKLGITRSAYSKLESGNTQPSDEIKEKLSQGFNIPLCELMGKSNLGLVFYFELEMSDGESKIVQLAPKDYPQKPKLVTNEWEALEYLKKKFGAIKGDCLASTRDGYDALDMQNLR